MNTAEIITKVYDDPFLNNSNKDFDFVCWVIKTPWLIYFRSVKFHYEKKHTDVRSVLALVKIVVASRHKNNEKNLCQDLLAIENTDSDLKASARAALCKWATPTRQTCLSKAFANSPNKVLVMIKHCLGNSQINSIPTWSKEFSCITFLYRTLAKVYALARADIIHSQREIKESFDPENSPFH